MLLKKDYGERQDEVISFAVWSSVANWGFSKVSLSWTERSMSLSEQWMQNPAWKNSQVRNGTRPLPDAYSWKSYKKGQDLTLKFYPNFIKIIIVTEWKCNMLKYGLNRWFFSPFYSGSFHNALIISESSIWLGEDALRCKCTSFTLAFYMLFIILYMHSGIFNFVELLTCSSN